MRAEKGTSSLPYSGDGDFTHSPAGILVSGGAFHVSRKCSESNLRKATLNGSKKFCGHENKLTEQHKVQVRLLYEISPPDFDLRPPLEVDWSCALVSVSAELFAPIENDLN